MLSTPLRQSPRSLRNRRQLLLENLETRSLMAANLTASLNLTNHILRVEGTDNNDTITVSNQSGQLSVVGVSIKIYNGSTVGSEASVDRSLVTRVEVRGLAGNDVVALQESKLAAGQAVPMTVWGGDGDDTIFGGSLADRLMGENGGDVILGKGGNDAIFGAFGTTDVETGSGTDALYGGPGNDTLRGGMNADWVSGDGGNDVLLGGDGDDMLIGGAGSDQVDGGTGTDRLEETAGDATLTNQNFTSRVYNLDASTWTLAETLAAGTGTFPHVDTVDTLNSVETATLTASDEQVGIRPSPISIGITVGIAHTNLDASNFSGDVIMNGSDKADHLVGGRGNDRLYGNGGDDQLDGGIGLDYLDGGAGNDELTVAQDWVPDTVVGGDGLDALIASATFAILNDKAFFYYDVYPTGQALPTWCPLSGIEAATISAMNQGVGFSLLGHTLIDATSFTGNCDLEGTYSTDFLYGGTGQDTLNGYDGDDYLAGNGGNDAISGGQGNDQLYGGNGNDTLIGDDSLYGDSGGNDWLLGEDGNDTLYGGGGNDNLMGGYRDGTLEPGNDWLYGGNGNDSLMGGDGNDQLYGEAGSDSALGGNGDDLIDGGEGDDWWLSGDARNDTIYGGGGNDTLDGEDGDDYLDGQAGADTLHGGRGNDTLYAIDQAITDNLYGDDGADELHFDGSYNGWDVAHHFPIYDGVAKDPSDIWYWQF